MLPYKHLSSEPNHVNVIILISVDVGVCCFAASKINQRVLFLSLANCNAIDSALNNEAVTLAVTPISCTFKQKDSRDPSPFISALSAILKCDTAILLLSTLPIPGIAAKTVEPAVRRLPAAAALEFGELRLRPALRILDILDFVEQSFFDLCVV